eukprot:TRINITY_DN84155_c0_g1_i1.p1 TRINITY_DN84155_c0_g1~~TRINITY_DN84155_c0_g1_i1.p1  ORF type:complete len:738 (+),score=94.03 TRINITY_DN84155_c0_g1_i1:49-2262(+)
MVRSAVRVVLRTRPTDNFASDCINLLDDGRGLTIHLPRKKKRDNYVNNQQEDWAFNFDSLLHNATQEMVYTSAAQSIVRSVFEGYNGTVMAYGQTGAGKTFTMTGGEDFRQRGLIPRAIADVFATISNKPEQSFEVRVSYVEIYNEHLYDLLADPDAPLVDLSIQEDSKGSIFVRGLTLKPAPQEPDALSHFFEGNANRVIADHKLNTNSTRSHCIWTVHLSSKSRVESDGHTTHSKLHFVDLAGSERISKTGSDGKILKEAMYINKSLTFLEQVVIALSTAGREHVPYRQTKLTNILKDAIGGNCKTTMIANIWTEEVHVDETISTLKFAQRMMRVHNDATVNLSIDPEAQVRRMAREIAELKSELQMQNQLHGKSHITYGEDLTDDERFQLQKEVRDYIDGLTPEIEVKTIRQVKGMFKIFKNFVQNSEAEARRGGGTAPPTANTDKGGNKGAAGAKGADDGVGDVEGDGGFGVGTAIPAKMDKAAKAEVRKSAEPATTLSPQSSSPTDTIMHTELPDRNQSYEDFKNNDGAQLASQLRSNQAQLREKKKQFRDAGSQLNDYKMKIDELRVAVENKRREHDQIGVDDEVLDEEEYKLLQSLKENKQAYKATYERMQAAKSAKDYCSRLVDQTRNKLMTEFDSWYESTYGVAATSGMPSIGGGSTVGQHMSGTSKFNKRGGGPAAAARPIEDDENDPGLELDDPEQTAYYAAKRAAQLSKNAYRGRPSEKGRGRWL